MIRRPTVLPTAVLALVALSAVPALAQTPFPRGRKVVKTDEQWRRMLPRESYLVTRHKETEAPFTGKYATSHGQGTYTCICCGADLFSSDAKFDSGTGWPSFWRPIDPKRIETAPDYHQAEPRVEVMCIDCGAHLGHVFNDGPPPTGLRFCLNSASLKFRPRSAAAKDKDTPSEPPKKSTRTASKTRSTAKAKARSKAKPQAPAAEDPPTPSPADDPKPATPDTAK